MGKIKTINDDVYKFQPTHGRLGMMHPTPPKKADLNEKK